MTYDFKELYPGKRLPEYQITAVSQSAALEKYVYVVQEI